MKLGRWMMAGAGLLLGTAGVISAQEPAPNSRWAPTAFETRNTGGTEEGEASIEKEKVQPRKVTFTAVTDSREWKDTTGKGISARLLAFEAAEGEVADLVRDGKVRLLVDGAKKFSLLPLEKLSTEDRTYIAGLAAARRQQAGEAKAADPAKP